MWQYGANGIIQTPEIYPVLHAHIGMDDPEPHLRADAAEGADTPVFDDLVAPADLVHGGRTRDDFLDAVLGLDDPATVATVADRAGHGRDAAREYLEWFAQLGIVERVTDSPAAYQLNRDYLAWRRVQQLRHDYDADELVAMLDTATDRDREYAAQFGAEAPDEVRLHEYADTTETSVEAAWRDRSAWRTVRRRIDLLERALTHHNGADDSRRRVA
jgi:hypothetical protein